MDCTWVEEHLSAYVDGELARTERAAVRRHLRTCPRCADKASDVVFVRERVRRLRASVPQEMFNLFIQFLLWTQPDPEEPPAPRDPPPPDTPR